MAVLAADRITKAAALHFLSTVPTVPLLPGIFHLTLIHNTGVAFGLFRGYGLWVTAGTLAALGGWTFFLWRAGHLRGRAVGSSLGMILGGAVGNLIDRVGSGAVIDFLDFRVWPVFNLADSCITVGAATLVLLFWRHR